MDYQGKCKIKVQSKDDKNSQNLKIFSFPKASFSASLCTEANPVEIGRELTGQELSVHAARKGIYAAKQINIVQKQGERKLAQMASDEKKFQADCYALRLERQKMKGELFALLEGEDK